jgi:hypothetical protein
MENNDFDDEYENDFDFKAFLTSIWFTGNGLYWLCIIYFIFKIYDTAIQR